MPYADIVQQRKSQLRSLHRKRELNQPWAREIDRRVAREKREKRQAVSTWKADVGCLFCGCRDPRTLECHHVLPETKTLSIARLVSGNYRMSRILSELMKCVVVCSGHHRQLHDLQHVVVGAAIAHRAQPDGGMTMAAFFSALGMHPQVMRGGGGALDIMLAVAGVLR